MLLFKHMNKISIFCWNIGNPSIERAKKQAEWLLKRSEDFFILTEAKGSKGCLFLKNFFVFHKYNVIMPDMNSKEYGVMAVSKYPFEISDFNKNIDFLPSRAISIISNFPTGKIEIIGLYVPSRNTDRDKIIKKRTFIEKISNALKRSSNDIRIVCGDFNILEPNHYPRYRFFKNWEYQFYNNLIDFNLTDAFRCLNPDTKEYSWVGKTGDGYRYDHIFISNSAVNLVNKCFYDHSPRSIRLSDHSGIIAEIRANI